MSNVTESSQVRFETLTVSREGGVLFADIAAPPMNLLGPELVHDLVSSLAHRIARFPAAGQMVVKDRVNAIALAPVEDFRRDSGLFGEEVRTPDAQRLIAAALKQGFQTRDAELDLAQMLGEFTLPALSARPS